jgi:predicted aspartyl protease
MGTFSVEIEVGNLEGTQFQLVDALVRLRRAGSSNTAIPENILRDLGVVPTGQRRFRLADESLVTYPIGQARVRLLGQDLVVLVVFTPEGTMPLLGASTLETFGLAADRVSGELMEVPGLMKRTAGGN